MRAKALLAMAGYAVETDFEVHDLQMDSRLIQENDIFIAVKGAHTDGHVYIAEALQKGAKLVLSEHEVSAFQTVVMREGHQTIADLAYYFYGEPTKDMEVIGVTGTNGKTTVTTLLYHALSKAGRRCALIGTNGFYYPDGFQALDNTTPDVLHLMRYFKFCKELRIHTVIMEVSSHALALGRVDKIRFKIAVFTNLTQDHLDFHKNMEDYFLSKMKLFTNLEPDGFAVLNADDAVYGRLKAATQAKVISYGIGHGTYQAKHIALSIEKTAFEVDGVCLKSQLISLANVYNLLSVYAIMRILGYSKEQTVKLIACLLPIAGRMEKVYQGDFFAIVDYAHSPDAVCQVLSFLSEIKKGHLIAVVGCGGERDKSKRPVMADTACRLADYVVLTSDNPRNENPQDILKDMQEGLNYSNYCVIVNRKEAIQKAVEAAGLQDIVAVLGKGHEDYQMIGTKKYHFSDKEEILKAIKGESI